jgi:hypothetical protein
MTRRSYLFFMNDLQRPQRADLGTDAARIAALLDAEVGIDQFEGSLRTDRHATPAIPADIPMYFEH